MIIRASICIPTYNNHETICDVIKGCIEHTELPVLVLDDGSDTSVDSLVNQDPHLKMKLNSGRLRILRHETNKGKGLALRTAIKDLISRNFTHLVSIDGDGQHLPSEISKLIEETKKNPWDIVIGARTFSSDTVPGISKFGRSFSNYWVNFQTETQISDSQSGFRVYPLFHLQDMSFFTKRFDFEIEVLIRLMWKKVVIRDVPIEVYYPAKEDRVSHFDKTWDNVRITILNIALIVVSLFTTRTDPLRAGVATFAGILIGTSPFYGLHTLIACGASFFFRLNGGIILLASQISIPPLVPLLVIASVTLGHAITGQSVDISGVEFSFEQLSQHFSTFIIGTTALGVILGTIFGALVSLILFLKQSHSRRARNWTGKMRGGVLGVWFLKTLTKYGGLKWSYACLYFIIPYFYVFAPKARKGLLQYWRIIDPKLGFVRLRINVIKHLHHFAQVLLDRMYQSFHTDKKFNLRSQGISNISLAMKEDRGLLVVGGHFGSWDIGARYMQETGIEKTFFMLQHDPNGLSLKRIQRHEKESGTSKLFSNREQSPILNVLMTLRNGMPVGFMFDRPFFESCELVPLFGKLFPVDTTPFRIAASSKTPILLCYGVKTSPIEYTFSASEHRFLNWSEGGSRELDTYNWTRDFTALFEKAIKTHPFSWFNFYPAWSSIPDHSLEGENVSSKEKLKPNHLLEEVNT